MSLQSQTGASKRAKPFRGHLEHGWIHLVLLAYTFIALFPPMLIIVNSFKAKLEIFNAPYTFPTPATFDAVGYLTVFSSARFDLYFLNSLIVTVISLVIILFVSSMAAFALAEYDFRGNPLLGIYLAIGIMVPIRLGTVSLLKMMVALGINNTLFALILVYVASGIPLDAEINTSQMSITVAPAFSQGFGIVADPARIQKIMLVDGPLPKGGL